MRILVSGYYGYGNLGDEALLAGLVADLSRRGHSVCVLSGDPAATRALHGVDAAHRYRGLPGALLRSDVVVSGGGGLLQDVTSRRSLRYYLGVIGLARRLGRRVLVYGQSIGPLTEAGRVRVARTLRGVPTAVRDEPSMALLRELAIPAERVADAALLMTRPAAPSPREGAPVVLVPRAGHDDLNDALAAAGRRLIDAGQPVALLPLHEREDGRALERLGHSLDAPRLTAADPTQALAHIAAARYVLSVRLHGLILAAVAGVGFAGLVYDPKVDGFLADAGAPALERPVDAEHLAKLALEAARPDAAAVERLRQRAEAGLDWLAHHITG